MWLSSAEVQQPKFIDPSLLTSVKGSFTPDNGPENREDCAYSCLYMGFFVVAVSQDVCVCLPDASLPLSDDETAGVSVYDITAFQPGAEPGESTGAPARCPLPYVMRLMCHQYYL